MVKINSSFIVNIKSAFQDVNKLYIVSRIQAVRRQVFHIHDGKRVGFNNDITKYNIMGLVLTLESLHNNMVYRDLKPEGGKNSICKNIKSCKIFVKNVKNYKKFENR